MRHSVKSSGSQPVRVASEGQPGVLLVREDVPTDRGDPAEFVEREDFGTGDVADPLQRRARGDFGDRVGDVPGGDGLDRSGGQTDGISSCMALAR